MDVKVELSGRARPSVSSPRISVIVPARNDPKRLAKCLSALDQSTLTDFEVIVADDASTDDTPIVAESMGAKVVRLPRQSGAAGARNAAAEIARGEIIVFVDADVCVHPDTLEIAAKALEDPKIDAVFGSYDLDPGEPNLLSQYKNLAHRFFHQVSREDVTTFWTGCGAIRREVFNRYKFDAERFPRPSIEDIDLGARMVRDGRRIRIEKNLQAKHLKRWTMLGIFRSDIFDRAIPWTRLILREKSLPKDLNLSIGQRIAALLAVATVGLFLLACCFRPGLAILPVLIYGLVVLADRGMPRAVMSILMLVSIAAAGWYAGWWMAAIAAPIAGIVLLNFRFYQFFLAHRGPAFAAAVLPMHFAYYLYSVGAFVIAHLMDWSDPRARYRVYALLALVLYLMSWSFVLLRAKVKDTTIDFAVGDAIGFYCYLPSLVIDRDLNFQNQLDAQGIVDADYRRDLKHNKWPSGVAMSIAPAFLVAHGIALGLHQLTGNRMFMPDGYSPVYFVLVVAWAMMIGTLGMIYLDRLLSERFKLTGPIVAVAILTTWFGTNYLWYFMREPLMAHMLGAAWVMVAIYFIHRIDVAMREGRLVWWHWGVLALATSTALACRLTNAFLLPPVVYLAVILIRRGFFLQALKFVPVVLIGCTPLVVEAVISQRLMENSRQVASPSTAPKPTGIVHDLRGRGYDEHEGFYWTEPALLRTLFSSRHGLFFSTPAYLLSVAGLIWFMRRKGGGRDPLLWSLIGSAILLWYVNAAWWAWWFGPSVGNRGFVELAAIFGIGFGFFFTWMSELRPRVRMAWVGVLLACFAVNYAVMGFKLLDLVEENQTLIPWEDRVLQGRWRRI